MLLLASGFFAWASSLCAQITANASVSPDSISYGDTVTITRDGQADAGVAYSEATIWVPDGSNEALSRSGLGTETYTPHSGPGTYWLQFRLVDNDLNYVDQCVSFTVKTVVLPESTITSAGSVTPDTLNTGDSVTITRDGSATRGVAYTDATVWAPDGSYDSLGVSGFGSMTYTPHSGPGVYWLQFRIVANDNTYADQWISFTVN